MTVCRGRWDGGVILTSVPLVDGEIVGALRLLFPLKDNLTVDIAVHPRHRRQGIGAAPHAEGKAPMVAVDTALGFEPAGQLSTWSLQL
jgi:hypothetical protein